MLKDNKNSRIAELTELTYGALENLSCTNFGAIEPPPVTVDRQHYIPPRAGGPHRTGLTRHCSARRHNERVRPHLALNTTVLVWEFVVSAYDVPSGAFDQAVKVIAAGLIHTPSAAVHYRDEIASVWARSACDKHKFNFCREVQCPLQQSVPLGQFAQVSTSGKMIYWPIVQGLHS
jgi:hypothetical protein